MIFLKDAQKTAVIFNDIEISFAELLNRISCYSDIIPKNTKVALIAENRPEWIDIIYAAWNNEAIPVIFDITVENDEFAAILNDAEPDLIFISQKFVSKFDSIRDKLIFKPKIIELENRVQKIKSAKLQRIERQNLEDTALIIYTSGTTDNPKGVMLSFNNLLSNIDASEVYRTQSDCGLILLPLYHIYPLVWTLLVPLYAELPTVFCPSLKAEDLLQTLQRYHPTIIVGVPRLFQLIRQNVITEINKHFYKKAIFKIVKKIDSLHLSKFAFRSLHDKFGGKLRYLICGGAAIDEETEKDYKALGFELQTGYGLTETSPMIAFNRPEEIKPGSVGTPLACNEVCLSDGEILVKGSNVMKGYYNNELETKQIIQNGWLHTGDLGTIDRDGYLYITGRKKSRLSLANGKNIFPEEIESKLLGISNMIKEVAVYAENNQLTAALYPDFSCLNQNKIVNIYETMKYDIIDQYNRNAASHKKINRFYLVKNEFPKTSMGKLKRYQIQSSESINISENKKEAEKLSKIFQELIQYLSQLKSTKIFLEDHIEIDAGLDSLDKINLLSFIESSFGIRVEEEALSRMTTVQQIGDFIVSKKLESGSDQAEGSKTDMKPIPSLARTWPSYQPIRWILRWFFKIYLNIDIKGLQHIPSGPMVIAPNQQSTLDAFFISIFLSRTQFENTYYLVKGNHFASRWKRILADGHHAIIVDINKNIKSSIESMAALLKKSKNILIFPEGTRTLDGSLGEFKKTFAILSQEQNVQVLPVCIDGSLQAMPRGCLFPKMSSKIKIEFLKPIDPAGLSTEEITQTVFNVVEKSLQQSESGNQV